MIPFPAPPEFACVVSDRVYDHPPMFVRAFRPRPFLRTLRGTAVFADYCARRGIDYRQGGTEADGREEAERWTEAFARLSVDEQATVELELARVNEMAGTVETQHLLDAAGSDAQPPADVP